MKKYCLLILFSVLLLTGCGGNRLVCTQKEESTSFKFESKYTFTLDGDKVKKVTLKSTGTLLGENNNEDAIENYKATAQNMADKYNEVEGIKAVVSNNKNKVTLTVELTAAALNDEEKENYGVNLNREELKELLESSENGYTCK